MPRSRSSPSPPPVLRERISETNGSTRLRGRKIRTTGTGNHNGLTVQVNGSPQMDWSTSYAAGSSSHGNVDSSDSDSSTDTDGRYRLSRSVLDNSRPLARAPSPPKHSRQYSISNSQAPGDLLNAQTPTRREFTRSRSPVPPTLNGAGEDTRSRSPVVRARKRVARAPIHALPAHIAWALRIPCTRSRIAFAMNTTLAVETGMLLGALSAAAGKLAEIRMTGMETKVDAWLPIGERCTYMHRACS